VRAALSHLTLHHPTPVHLITTDQTYITVKRHGSGTKYRADGVHTCGEREGDRAGGWFQTNPRLGGSAVVRLTAAAATALPLSSIRQASRPSQSPLCPPLPPSVPLCPPPPSNLSPVVAVGHAVDLAVLTVADESFWTQPTRMLPLAMGDIPQLQENVLVIGYPTGGDNTSVTSGVVSRVEVRLHRGARGMLGACCCCCADVAGPHSFPLALTLILLYPTLSNPVCR